MKGNFRYLPIVLFTLVAPLIPSPVTSEVVFPPDMTLTSEKKITVYGFVEDEGPIQGEVNLTRKFELEGDEFYRGDVELFPGMNVINLEGASLKVFSLEKGGLDSFKMLSGDKELIFYAYRVHPALEEGCESCHEYDGGDISLIGEVIALCVECHDDPAKETSGEKKPYVHSPVEEEECAECHDPHFSKNENLLTEEKICLECHDDKAPPEGENANVHDPVAKMECTACHDPHASAHKYQLKRGGVALCFGCHEDFTKDQGGYELAFVHEPVSSGECFSCHNPHFSRLRDLLTEENICLECHDEKDPEGGEFESVHSPVKKMECSSCHSPHGSPFRYQLLKEGNKLCVSCHKEPHRSHREPPSETADFHIPEKFPLDKDGSLSCTGCHDPHFTGNRRLFTEEEAILCIKCHKL